MTDSSLALDPQPPVIPDHTLLRRIGGGSYGDVWLARSTLGTLRAVKVVRRAAFDDDRPYEREFAGLQKFEPLSRTHKGFVDLLQVGRNDAEGWFYYVMELADDAGERKKAEGGIRKDSDAEVFHPPTSFALHNSSFEPYSPLTLSASVKLHGAHPLDGCLRIARTLTEALVELHRHGLVHRDIKPSNIIFVNGVPKLADVGLVAVAKGVGQDRSFVGTEGFIPSEGPGTPAADLYSLGIVLYVLGTGKSHRDFPEPPADLATRPDRERWLEFSAVIHRAAAADSRQRYGSTTAMLADLTRLGAGKSLRSRAALLRGLRRTAVGASIVLALAGAWIFFLVEPRRMTRRKEEGWSRWTTNRLAWETYVRAGTIGNNLTRATHTNALAEYERAIALDPNFAYARAELALQLVCNNYGGLPADSALARAKSEANQALGQEQSLSRGWQALAIAAAAEHDLTLAERHYRQAIQTDSEEFFGHLNFANFLIACGRLAEAREELALARRYDPTWPHTDVLLGKIEMLDGHFDEAITSVDAGIALQANRASGYFVRGDIRWQQGDRETAASDWLHALRLSDVDEAELAKMQNAFRAGGSTNFVKTNIEWLEGRLAFGDHGRHFELAKELARLGQHEEALNHLDRSVDEREAALWVNASPEFRGLRGDPRFHRILERLGLAAR